MHSPPIRDVESLADCRLPHRSKAVWYAGRGVDDNSRLEALTIHPSGQLFLLSSNESVLIARFRSSRFYDCALLLNLSRLAQKFGFRLNSSSFRSRPQFTRLGQQKKEEPQHRNLMGSSYSARFHVAVIFFRQHFRCCGGKDIDSFPHSQM